MTILRYKQTAADPSWKIWWRDDQDNLVDFSAGYTWSLKVWTPGGATLLTKTTGLTGDVGSGVDPTGVPNLVVVWSSSDFAAIPPGSYEVEITPTVASRKRDALTATLIIIAAAP